MFEADPDGNYRALAYDEKKEFSLTKLTSNVSRKQVNAIPSNTGGDQRKRPQDEAQKEVIDLD